MGKEEGIDFNSIAADVITNILTDTYKGIGNWFTDKKKEKDFFGLAARNYSRRVWERYNTIRVFGMSDDVPLEDLFVRVNILEKIHERYRDSAEFLEKNFNWQERSYGYKRETKPGIDCINTHDKMIVIGKPGAGKSTYLKFLALQSIKKNSDIKDRRIPVFISLKEMADKNIPLINFIEYQFDICSLENPSLFLENLLEKGKCLILLDGLDEVQEERKDQVIQDIIDFSEKYTKNQFVLSCRVAAYNWWFQKFTDVEMADFDDNQIEEFIKNWFKKEPKTAEECWQRLKNDAPLKEISTIPLLLTLLCIVYNENLNFPHNRAELYEEAINALLKKWDASRRIKRWETYKNLSLSRKKSMFYRIAARTFEEGKYFLKRSYLVLLIQEYIRNLPDIDHESITEVAESILDNIVANHGIFVIRAKDIYSFTHLTFQEYFTAQYIVTHASEGSLVGLIDNHVEEAKWQEVFLLTVSLLNNAEKICLGIHIKANDILKMAPELQKLFTKREIMNAGVFKDNYDHIKILNLFFALNLALVRTLTHDLDISRGRILVRALVLVRALARALDNNLDLNIDLDFVHELTTDRDNERALDRARALDHALERAHASDLINIDNSILVDKLLRFLQIKVRLFNCLNTECYVSAEMRQWLRENVLEHTTEMPSTVI